jgi:hypothetical protein
MKHTTSDFLNRGAIVGEDGGSGGRDEFANALRGLCGDCAQSSVAIDTRQSLPDIGQRYFDWKGEDDMISVAA